MLLGEGVELFSIRLPASLDRLTLRESGIGSRTGMSVVGVQRADGEVGPVSAEMVLTGDLELVMLGSRDQRRAFAEAYEQAGRPG